MTGKSLRPARRSLKSPTAALRTRGTQTARRPTIPAAAVSMHGPARAESVRCSWRRHVLSNLASLSIDTSVTAAIRSDSVHLRMRARHRPIPYRVPAAYRRAAAGSRIALPPYPSADRLIEAQALRRTERRTLRHEGARACLQPPGLRTPADSAPIPHFALTNAARRRIHSCTSTRPYAKMSTWDRRRPWSPARRLLEPTWPIGAGERK